MARPKNSPEKIKSMRNKMMKPVLKQTMIISLSKSQAMELHFTKLGASMEQATLKLNYTMNLKIQLIKTDPITTD